MRPLARPAGTAEDIKVHARTEAEPVRYATAAINQPMQDTIEREDADVVGE